MKIVDVIYPSKIFDPNGASTVVRLLYESRKIFFDEGISIRFYSKDIKGDNVTENNTISIPQQSESYKPLKAKLKKLFTKLPLGTISDYIKIYRTFMIGSKKIAREFVDSTYAASNGPIFIHDIFTCYYYLKYRKDNRPILLVLHNNGETFKMLTYYYPRIKNSWIMNKFNNIEKFVLDRVDKLVFVSKNSRSIFLKNHPKISPNKVYYVYNGIPTKNIEKSVDRTSPKIELCCVASITDRKGQEIIVDALGKLTEDQRSKIHITFIGDGYLKAILEKRAFNLGLKDCVKFVGIQKDVDSFLSKSDIFILTSFDEGLPMSIIEAQRAKLPIISTLVAGIPEMIEHETSGLLINPSVSELLPIFNKIDSYNWGEMGENSYKIYINKFSLENMILNYTHLLKEMAN